MKAKPISEGDFLLGKLRALCQTLAGEYATGEFRLSTTWAARRLDTGAGALEKRLQHLLAAGELELIAAANARLRRAPRYRLVARG
jgi:hypothetical protein